MYVFSLRTDDKSLCSFSLLYASFICPSKSSINFLVFSFVNTNWSRNFSTCMGKKYFKNYLSQRNTCIITFPKKLPEFSTNILPNREALSLFSSHHYISNNVKFSYLLCFFCVKRHFQSTSLGWHLHFQAKQAVLMLQHRNCVK